MKPVILSIAFALAFACATPASASLQIWLQANSGGWVKVADATSGTVAVYSGVYGGFDVFMAATSNSSGGPTQSELGLASLYVINNGSTGTLDVLFGDSDFLSLSTGTILQSGIGGSQAQGSANEVLFETFVNFGNSNDATDTMNSASMSSGVIDPDLSNTSFFAFNSVSGFTGGASFSMAAVASVTLDNGENITFDGSANSLGFAAAVPEPGTIVIWSLLGVFGFVMVNRRRKFSLIRT